MTAPNPNWSRWIISSIAEYYSVNVTTPLGLPLLVAGIDDRDAAFEQSPDRAEVRVNGPFTTEQSKGYWYIQVDINILISSNMGGEVKHRYTLENNTGKFHEYADTCIPIFRYGDPTQTPENDGTQLGYLSPKTGKNDSVRSLYFGQMNSVDRIRQSQIDAKYIMYVCTSLNN